MNPQVIKPFIVGAIFAYALAALLLGSSAKLGVLPVQADVAPSRLEAAVLGAALHSAVARQAPGGRNPVAPSDESLISGAKLYRQMCSSCHGLSKESDNSFGESFYPPAPHLPRQGTSYSETEVFWIVKHGVRNTAMPAWSRHLSDDEIWQIAALIRRFDSLPAFVTQELVGGHH